MRKDVIKGMIALHQHEMPYQLIERDVELPIDRDKIVTVPGVRRCGKSTMMQLAINRLLAAGVPRERMLWMGFDDERLRYMGAEGLDDVLAAYMEMHPDIDIADVYMFFDEIQLIEGWEYFVLRVYKSYCRHIYVCGSNATMLSSEMKSALRGYPLEYATYPLSFSEYCRFRGIDAGAHMERDVAAVRAAALDYLRGSAFPEVVLAPTDTERIQMLQGYFDTMLLRDLAEHYGVRNTAALRYFVKRVLANVGKPTSINGVYNDIRSQGARVSKDELYRWADYACDIFMLLRVHKYTRSLRKETSSPDKFYCIDNGLRTSVLMPQSHDHGQNLESAVLLELERRRQPFEKITYYHDTVECDFVVQRGDAVAQLIQVCWDMGDTATREREVRGLLGASAATGCTQLLIITRDEEAVIARDGLEVQVVPAWKWMLHRGNGNGSDNSN